MGWGKHGVPHSLLAKLELIKITVSCHPTPPPVNFLHALKITGLGPDNSDPCSPFCLKGEPRREDAPKSMCPLLLRGPKLPSVYSGLTAPFLPHLGDEAVQYLLSRRGLPRSLASQPAPAGSALQPPPPSLPGSWRVQP